MATITKRGDKQWQAKVRKKGYPVQTKTFPTKAMAEQWSRLAESEMDRGVFVSTTISEQTTLDGKRPPITPCQPVSSYAVVAGQS